MNLSICMYIFLSIYLPICLPIYLYARVCHIVIYTSYPKHSSPLSRIISESLSNFCFPLWIIFPILSFLVTLHIHASVLALVSTTFILLSWDNIDWPSFPSLRHSKSCYFPFLRHCESSYFFLFFFSSLTELLLLFSSLSPASWIMRVISGLRKPTRAVNSFLQFFLRFLWYVTSILYHDSSLCLGCHLFFFFVM